MSGRVKNGRNGREDRVLQEAMRTEPATKVDRPVMKWESNEPFDAEGRIVWWSRVDGRYQVEVQRAENGARLLIFDHDEGDRKIHEQKVGLSYGAIFGPDVTDVAHWQELTLNFIDSIPKK